MADNCETDSDFAFVAALEHFPCLWNPGHPDYKNRDVRTTEWQRISEVSGVRDVESRYKCIRDKLTRRTKIPASGSGAKRQMPWSLESSLGFLRTTLEAKKTSTSNAPPPRTCLERASKHMETPGPSIEKPDPIGSTGLAGQGRVTLRPIGKLMECDVSYMVEDEELSFEDPLVTSQSHPVTTSQAIKRPSLDEGTPVPPKKTALAIALQAIAEIPPIAIPEYPVRPPLPFPAARTDNVNTAFTHTLDLSLQALPPAVSARLRGKIFALLCEEEIKFLE